MTIRLPALIALALLTSACIKPETSREQCDILYQCVRIDLGDSPAGKNNKHVLDYIFNELQVLGQVIHPQLIGGVTRVNGRLASGEWSSINPSLFQLTKDIQALAQRSNGTLNPAIGKLITLWGFHQDPKGQQQYQRPDSKAILNLLKQNPLMDDIEFDGIRVRSKNPAVNLQFGLLYQGHITRLVRTLLQDAGYTRGRIITNNLLTTVGIDTLYQQSTNAPGYNIKPDETLCRASIEDHGFTQDGRYYHRYLDPDTGYPAPTIESVIVIDDDPLSASAACQALMASDGRDWEITSNMMQVTAGKLRWKNGQVAISKVMAERVAKDNLVSKSQPPAQPDLTD